MKCDPAVIIHLDTSVSTDNSPAARLVTPSRMTFDSFLESGGKLDSKHNPRDLDDARTLSLADIRDWRGTSETVTEDELDRLVVERRSKLWRIVLASSEHLNTPPFTVPVDPRPHMTLRRADRRTEMWGSIRPSETVYPDLPRLMPDMPPEREHIYRPFMIPIGPRSRASHYVLRPRSSSHHSLPLQQIHISPYAIPPELADIPCKTMTASQLLSEINDIFGTAVTLSRVQKRIDKYVSSDLDLGTAYAEVRPWWPPPMTEPDSRFFQMNSRFPPFIVPGYRRQQEWMDDARAPRRLWDLYSNRVVVFDDLFFCRKDDLIPDNVWAVSHSWVDDLERHSITTTVNGGQWPVPLPKATTLDHIRIELLNMGAEYVFLDVLCMRQAGDPGLEAQRQKEWRTDVPTLGHVYRHSRYQTTVVYFNGLGLPLDLRRSELESPFHWINRSWTLQETVLNWLPGGLSGEIPGVSEGGALLLRGMRESLVVSIAKQPGLKDLLDAFLHRPGYADKKPFDQVTALSYLRPHNILPAYHEEYVSAEDAWDEVIPTLDASDHLYLLTCYPLSRQLDPSVQCHGFSSKSWWPTWNQLLAHPHYAPIPTVDYSPHEMLCLAAEVSVQTQQTGVSYDMAWHCHSAYVVQGCSIAGVERRLTVGSETFKFQTFANVPGESDGEFTLVGVAGLECWILCRAGFERRLVMATSEEKKVENMLEVEKVTVGRMDGASDRERLRGLNLGCVRFVCYWYRFTQNEV